MLAEVGATKMAVIKTVKEVTGLGLKGSEGSGGQRPEDPERGCCEGHAEEMKKSWKRRRRKVELK